MILNSHSYSEEYRIAAEDWCDKEAAASLLEDTKGSVMAQKQQALGDIPVNRAEQLVKASLDWVDHIEKIVEARRQANLAKVHLEVIRMRYYESQSLDATKRAEMRMMGDVP